MAKIVEQTVIIKFSKLMSDTDAAKAEGIILDDQMTALTQSIPELVESILNDTSIIIEIE